MVDDRTLLQTKLPEIWKAAYSPDADADPQPFKLWGVTIDPKNPGADARVSVVLMKFLRARYVFRPVRNARDLIVYPNTES